MCKIVLNWGNDYDDMQIDKNGYVYQYCNLNELQQQLIKIIEENKFDNFGKYSIKISRKFQQQCHYKMLQDLSNEIHFKA